MNKRGFLKTSLAASGLALSSAFRSSASNQPEPPSGNAPELFDMPALSFSSNPLLETLAPLHWQGTPLDASGRFQNLNFPFIPRFSSVLKWKTGKNPLEKEKKHDHWMPEFRADGDFLSHRNDCIVWLGHASFFIRMNGKNILIDPVFGRATVVKRLQESPYPTEVWKNIHLILLSHDHRDHCDVPSLKVLARQNPDVQVFTGLGMKKLLSEIFPSTAIFEAGWYQKFSIPEPEIWFMPARHWSKRNLTDTNQRLWGGFYIGGSRRIFFMGDSGMDRHFADLPGLHPPPDYAIMGIGAYSPEWFMHPSHMRPEDSWQCFTDLQAGKMIPMHFGTFDLSDEPASEPLRRLQALADMEKLLLPSIGETLRL